MNDSDGSVERGVLSGRGAQAALLLSAGVLVAAGIKAARPLFAPFFLAGFLAVVTAPLMFRLVKRGVPTWAAVIIALLVDVLVLVALSLIIGGSVTVFSERLPYYQSRLSELLGEGSAWLATHGVEATTDSLRKMTDPGFVMGTVASLVRGVAGVVSQLVLVLIIVAFMLVEATHLHGKFLSILKIEEKVDRLRDVVSEVNAYLVVKTVTSLVTGLLIVGVCTATQVDLPLLWGVLAFLLNFIPTVGSIIAAVPAVLLAMLQHGPATALAVALGYLAVNFIIGNIVEPRVMGRALGLSPLVVFLSMVVWGWLLGPVGALLSSPLTVLVKTGLAYTDDLQWVAVMLGPSPDESQSANPEPASPEPASTELDSTEPGEGDVAAPS